MILIYTLFGWLVGIIVNYLAHYLPEWRFAQVSGDSVPASAKKFRSVIVTYITNRAAPDNPSQIRGLIVELFTPLLFAFLWWRYHGSALLFWYTLYSAILLLITIIDMERRLILNVVIYPAIVIALIGAFLTPGHSWLGALIGGAFCFVVLWLIFGGGAFFVSIVHRLLGHEVKEVPFGMGDIKLGLFIGLITGFPHAFFALLFGILAGGLGAGIYIFVKAVILKRYSAYSAIPYGPFLIFGGAVMLFWGEGILRWYIGTG